MSEIPNIIDLPGLMDFINSKKKYIQDEYEKLLAFIIVQINNNMTLENSYKVHSIYYDIDLTDITQNEITSILNILSCKLKSDLDFKGYNSIIVPYIFNNINDQSITYGIDSLICAEVSSLFF